MAIAAAAFYLVAYFITTIGAFGVVSVVSGKDRDADLMEDYQGLAWRRPWLAAVFSAMLFSLAGIPLTAGFVGKFYVVGAGAESSLWALVVVLVINSAIGLFYYLRIIAALFERTTEGQAAQSAISTSGYGTAKMGGWDVLRRLCRRNTHLTYIYEIAPIIICITSAVGRSL